MAHQFQQKQVKKEATKQAKSNDNKTPMQNQEIFQMRWEANMAMQRQEEHTGTTEGQNNLAQLKEEDELQAKSAPTQFFVSEEEQEKKPMQAKVAQKAGSEEEELMQGK